MRSTGHFLAVLWTPPAVEKQQCAEFGRSTLGIAQQAAFEKNKSEVGPAIGKNNI
jgi:hypothetical protein